MYDSSKLKHYNIKGKDIVKCRGMLFTEWCELNDFEYMVDEIDLDYLFNNYGLTLKTLSQGFDKNIHWICSKDSSHEMWFKPVHRTNGHWECHYCKGSRLSLAEHSVKAELPHLLDEWAYDRNILLPEFVSTGLIGKAWWKCRDCNEYFEQSPYKRKIGQGCPYCKNLKIKQGLNDLFTIRPDLIDEWDWENNKDCNPYELPAGSDLKVNWVCKNNHRWVASITARANAGNNCTYCSSSVSFPERALAFYLSMFFSDVYRRYKIEGFEYDIYMPEENIVIEYNGFYWHSNKQNIDNYKIELANKYNLNFIGIDSLRDVPKNYISIINNSISLFHIECFCEKAYIETVDNMLKLVIENILSRFTTDTNKYLSYINCKKDLSNIVNF